MTKLSRLATPRTAIIAGLALAIVFIVVAVTFSSLATTRTATPQSTKVPIAGESNVGPVIPSSSGMPSSGGPSTGSTPKPVAPRTSTEVQQGTGSSSTLPPSAPLTPLYSGPIPRTASASGSLVTGFPVVIPVAQGSKISSSSVSSSGNIVQATLSAKTTTVSAELITYYETQFAKLGLQGSPNPAVGGSTAVSFSRGKDTITLTVTPTSGGGSRYTVFGVLVANA